VGQGVKEVVVAKEETRDVLVPEDQYLLGFFVYFVNMVVVKEEVMLIDLCKYLLFLNALKLFLIYSIYNGNTGVNLLREINRGVTTGSALLPLLLKTACPPKQLDVGLDFHSRLLTLLLFVIVTLVGLVLYLLDHLHSDLEHLDRIVLLDGEASLLRLCKEENEVCVLVEALEVIGDVVELPLVEAI
jgi:hypothetical protein